MTEQITLKQALELVSFKKEPEGHWEVVNVYNDINGDVFGIAWGNVHGTVWGDVRGNVRGNVHGNVWGDVRGNVHGDVSGDVGSVHGTVNGTINGRSWEFVETPQEKLERLIQESGNQELIEAFNQQQQENN